jgi:7-keto-8-aminopelargonate synthetase-like enzyme
MSEPESLPQVGRTGVHYQGRTLTYFAGCDYFRMASAPSVLKAVTTGLKKYGLNVAASRVTTGNHALYGELEKTLSRYFGAPAALVVSNGYSTNGVVAQALRGEFSHVLIDAKAHVSLRDASRLFDCPVLEFKSRDAADLRRALARCGARSRPILLTDGVYTYESDVAPLRDYLRALGPKGMILLDDAHGAGVLGARGRGTPELAGVSRGRIIQTATLSKAFGVYGGAILCSRELREKMIAKSTMFAGSTPLPLPLVFAAICSVKRLQSDRSLRRRLNENVRYVKSALGRPLTPVPVAAVTPTDAAHAAALRKQLLARGIFPSFIKYPGGPVGGYLRIVISSEHTKKQLDSLLAVLKG